MPGIDFSGFADGLMPMFQQMAKANKEKEAYERQLSQVDAWSRMGIKQGQVVPIDPNVKDKDIIPFVNQKALDDIRNNRSHSVAQKRGELDAYASMVRMNVTTAIQQAARAAAKPPQTTESAFPGGPQRTIPQTQAYSADIQREAARQRALANAPKEAREVRRDVREEGRYTKEMGQPESDFIKSQPEIKFFDKTGMPPSAFLTPQSVESGYTAKQKATGNTIGDFAPLQPGGKLDLSVNRKGWDYFKQTVLLNRPSNEPDPNVEFIPKPMMDPNTGQPMIDPNTKQPIIPAFRVKEYKYGGVPTKGKPADTVYAPDPEGEFLQMGDKRVPYQDVAEIRAIADTRKREALQALSIHPELRPAIENRLQQWHYDLTNPFWADLYK